MRLERSKEALTAWATGRFYSFSPETWLPGAMAAGKKRGRPDQAFTPS
jgi:hypothetical protein